MIDKEQSEHEYQMEKMQVEEVEIGGSEIGYHAICRFQPLFDGRWYFVCTHVTEDGREITSCTDIYGKEVLIQGGISESRESILDGIKETERKLKEKNELEPKGYKGLLGGAK